MDPSWNFIGNPVPRNSVKPITGYMDPNVGLGNICGPEVPYHNTYLQECNYNTGPPENPKIPYMPRAKMVNVGLKATTADNINPAAYTTESNNIYDIKNALFKTTDSANELEYPVQVFDIKENYTAKESPWWSDPSELINFKGFLNETQHQSNLNARLIIVIALSLIMVIFVSLHSYLFIIIIIIAAIAIVINYFTSSKEGFAPWKGPMPDTLISPMDRPNYLPPMAPCETPAGVIDSLAPETLRKNHPNLFKSTNQNWWEQANRQFIKKVCPTTAEHGEAIRYIYGDNIKRHIFY